MLQWWFGQALMLSQFIDVQSYDIGNRKWKLFSLLSAEHNCLRLLVSNRWFGHLSKTFCDWKVNAWTLWDKGLKGFREWKWAIVILF